MIINVTFNENSQSFKAAFGEIAKLPDESYKVGYEQGAQDGYNNGYTNGEQDGYNNGFAASEDNIAYLNDRLENTLYSIDTGGKSYYDAFWDAFQNVTRRQWGNIFQDVCWNDNTFYPKYDIKPIGSSPSLFRYCAITDLEGRLNECGVILDTSESTYMNCAFGEAKLLTRIPTIDISKCAGSSGASHGVFAGCLALKSIRKLIVSEGVFLDSAFTTCYELEDITIDGVIGTDTNFKWSTKLTKASIENIINHLSDTATGKTLTLSKAAVDNAFTADEWSALVGSKNNWTITLT